MRLIADDRRSVSVPIIFFTPFPIREITEKALKKKKKKNVTGIWSFFVGTPSVIAIIVNWESGRLGYQTFVSRTRGERTDSPSAYALRNFSRREIIRLAARTN